MLNKILFLAHISVLLCSPNEQSKKFLKLESTSRIATGSCTNPAESQSDSESSVLSEQNFDDLYYDLMNNRHIVSKQMNYYIATPFCYCRSIHTRKLISQDCRNCGLVTFASQDYQTHGGDLFQHSQWSALNLDRWVRNDANFPLLHQLITEFARSELTRDIFVEETQQSALCSHPGCDINEVERYVVLSGFFHDIGKGGDYVYDMYQDGKYGAGKTDADHPERCADYIRNPGNAYKGELKPLLDSYFAEPFFKNPKMARDLMAMTADVHWELGKTNIPLAAGGWKPDKYIKRIFEAMDKFSIHRKYRFAAIKLCILVSTADIASGYNDELLKSNVDRKIEIEGMKHRSLGGPWIKFNFITKHENLIQNILNSNYLITQQNGDIENPPSEPRSSQPPSPPSPPAPPFLPESYYPLPI